MKELKKIVFILSIAVLLLAAAGCVQPDDTNVNEQEEQLIEEEQTTFLSQKEYTVSQVNAAIDLIDEKGELAFPEFREKDSQWYHDDSYITIWKTEGIRVVFPPKVSGEGGDVNDLEDYNGEPLGRMLIDTALCEEGEGWVNYYWPKPGETTPSKKSTFVKRTSIDNQTYLVHSGFYVNDYIYTNDVEDLEHFSRFGDVFIGNLFHPAKADRELDVNYSIAHVIIKPDKSIEPHMMKNPEVYYVLEGEGLLYIEDVPFELSKGKLVHIPANSKQHTENTGIFDLEFFAINQPSWAEENEEMVE
ncbi:cache domain-containing protein [Methanococcoides seepicolus]|uniref:Cache domain-containing protein n=1 Tax=Methanococcoides seepicolus TaxID=2828780 RepID=A0A9E4ZFB5_9EURY|nr:cache domain-containing protein [Methanococcoides seepicolus]MCM1986657.1 cache domain-containing protein [Methanococcoides seepicolus]